MLLLQAQLFPMTLRCLPQFKRMETTQTMDRAESVCHTPHATNET
jgi:hypothetical protein